MTEKILPEMMTNKKIIMRHHHKKILTQEKKIEKIIITVKDCFFLLYFIPFLVENDDFDEMMRSIFHKDKAEEYKVYFRVF